MERMWSGDELNFPKIEQRTRASSSDLSMYANEEQQLETLSATFNYKTLKGKSTNAFVCTKHTHCVFILLFMISDFFTLISLRAVHILFAHRDFDALTEQFWGAGGLAKIIIEWRRGRTLAKRRQCHQFWHQNRRNPKIIQTIKEKFRFVHHKLLHENGMLKFFKFVGAKAIAQQICCVR